MVLKGKVKKCSIEDCHYTGPNFRRGWCVTHYKRWQSTGDPLGLKKRKNGTEPYEAILFHGYVRTEEDCFLFNGAPDSSGYGMIGQNGKCLKAHRVSYEKWFGPIPDGHHIDHICHNKAAAAGLCSGGPGCKHRRCVNPGHLEAVLPGEHVGRSVHSAKGRPPSGMGAIHAIKTHCPRGHEYSADNTMIHHGSRECRTCLLDKGRERSATNRANGLTWNGKPRKRRSREEVQK